MLSAAPSTQIVPPSLSDALLRTSRLRTLMLDTTRLSDLAINAAGFAFDPTTGHTYNLNATGLFILQALKTGNAPEQIIEQLQDTFDLDPEADVSRDVGEFTRQLREQGLLR